MIPFNVDISLEDVGRVKNSLDPIDLQDLVTKAWFLANASTGSSYQKYFIGAESYTIPINFSSVISGPFEVDSGGIVTVDGRLEIL